MAHHLAHAVPAVLLAGAVILGTCVPLTGAEASIRSTPSAMSTVPVGTWHAQSSGTQQPLFAVSCFDAMRCKAVGAGGSVRYTKNAGTTWRAQANPLAGSSTILYRIACVAPSTCYVIGRPNTVLVTHNGGASWTTHRLSVTGVGTDLTDPACVAGQSADLRGRRALCRLGLLDVACVSASTCYVVATGTIPGVSGGLTSAVFLTTDGGSTWTAQIIPATAPCQAVCDGPGGRTFYPLEWISCGPGSLCRAGGSLFLGSHSGYASMVIETRTPGTPWTPVNHSYLRTSPDTAVCPTMTRCYGLESTDPFALAGSGVSLSSDGGGNWRGLNGRSPRIRNAIACPGPRTCYTVGNQGTITASMNGGPFVAQSSRTSHDLYGVACVDVNRCFAVGNKGTIVVRTKT